MYMKNRWRKSVGNILENTASELALEQGCMLFWGEIEVPECLRKELEEKQEQE